jgi:L-lactate dehydrogenase complex protein LldG
MEERIIMPSRDKIINQIKRATQVPSHLDTPPSELDSRLKNAIKDTLPKNNQGLWEQFEQELLAIAGEFKVCENLNDALKVVKNILSEEQFKSVAITDNKRTGQLAQQLDDIEIVRASEIPYPERKDKLANTPAALLDANYAISEIGSLAVLYKDAKTTLPYFLSDCVIVLISVEQIVANLLTLVEQIPAEQAKNMVLMTGPSRTADIEKVLVLGAHGPRRLVCLMIKQ